MEFSLGEDQQSIIELSRKIFRDRYPADRPSPANVGLDRATWQVLADAGLLGLCLDEQHGGSGLELALLADVLEAQGLVLAPVPLLESSAAAQVLQRCGNAAVTGAWLADSVSGTRILGLALDGLVSADPRGQLQIQGDTATLDGTWDHVPYGRDLDAVLVVARTATGEPALVLVPTASAGVSIDEAWGSHALPWDQLQVKGASLDASLVLARGDAAEEALAWLVPLLLTGLSALQLGVVSEALERTARYTCERQQFKRPIASFQAVLHRAADGYIDREALRSTVWQAAWRLGQGRDAALQARAAKWWACEAGHRIGHSAQHLHGGIGSDLEYPIHRYFLWAKQIEFTLGGASQQLAQLGNHLATHQFEGFPL